ncbi:MAG TPA: TonB-dependent siderophore receptor [Opitutus sp.]|nr:TonB-dependent siderophore receptor [Opitutus sp.]
MNLPNVVNGHVRVSRLAAILGCAVAFHAEVAAQTASTPAAGDDVVVLNPFVVSAGSEKGYTASEVVSASRFNQKIKDVPQTIVVLTDEFLKDISASSLYDVIPLIGGVPSAATRNADTFSIRGFGIQQLYIDGFRDVQEWGGGEFAQVQQLEVIKGPASNLFGNARGFGGIINRISKRPLLKQWEEIAVTGGSYDYLRATADVTGPIDEKKKFLYRVNVAYTSSDSFRDLHDMERVYASPVLEWKPTPTTDVTLFTEFMYEHHQEDNYIPTVKDASGNQVLTVPISRSIDEPWQKSLIQKQSARLTVDQRIGEHVTARVAAFRTYINNPIDQVEFLSLAADNRTVNRRAFDLNRHESYTFIEGDLLGTFQTGPISHQLALEADYFDWNYRSNVRRAPLASIDLYDPVYGAPMPDFFGPTATLATNTLGQSADKGIAATYQAGLFHDKLLLVAGTRHDEVTSHRQLEVVPYQDIHDAPNKATVPRYGVVVKPTEQISLYYQYAEAFQGNLGGGFRIDGSPLDPTTGKSSEFGVKASLFHEHLQVSLASFDVQVVNQPVRLPAPNNSFFENSGSNESKGQELNLTYNNAHLSIMAGWVNQDVRPTTGGITGAPIPGVPRNQAQLFVRYRWDVNPYGGLSVGGGVVYQDRRPLTSTAGAQMIPGYERYYLTAGYNFRKDLKLGLSVANLFDKEYIAAANGILWRPGDPRTIKVTLTKSW